MTDLSGLYGVERVGDDLTIQNNPCLTTEAAEALSGAIGVENIGGEVSLSNNGGGGGC